MLTLKRSEDGLLDPLSLVFSDGRPCVAVDPEIDCWIWLGAKMRGYARVRVGKRPSVQAHRHIYEMAFGRVPEHIDVGHTCLRRSCVNPAHMETQSKQQNAAERYQIPALGKTTRGEIEEALFDDKPHSWISNTYGISFWAIRRISEEMIWKDQYKLSLEVPF